MGIQEGVYWGEGLERKAARSDWWLCETEPNSQKILNQQKKKMVPDENLGGKKTWGINIFWFLVKHISLFCVEGWGLYHPYGWLGLIMAVTVYHKMYCKL